MLVSSLGEQWSIGWRSALTPAERKEYPSLYSQDVVKAQRAAAQWLRSHAAKKQAPTSSLGLMNKVGLTDTQRTAILKIFHRWNQGPPRRVAEAQSAAEEAYKAYTHTTPDDANFKALAKTFAKCKARAEYEDSLWTSKMHAEINGTLTPHQRKELAHLEHTKRPERKR